MRRVCAWCDKDMGRAETNSYSDAFVTHGICNDCVHKFFEPQRSTLQQFLDSLDAPVLVVDGAATVKGANMKARRLLKRELAQIEGDLAGDVFECVFAKHPEGCGRTVHCDGCTMRITVADTYVSGRSHLKTPATISCGTTECHDEIQLYISTEKVDNVVFLRIDSVGTCYNAATCH